MVKVKLDKRGHMANLSFAECDDFGYVLLITGTDDIGSVQMKIEVGEIKKCKDLFNSMVRILVGNGYKLID